MVAIMPIDERKYYSAERLRLQFAQVPKQSIEEVRDELDHRFEVYIGASNDIEWYDEQERPSKNGLEKVVISNLLPNVCTSFDVKDDGAIQNKE